MANMFFAKINVNSDVYKLYDNPEFLDKILDKVIANIDQQKSIVLNEEMDSKNNGDRIKFISIEKDIDKRYIMGRIIRIYKDDLESYDKNSDDIIKLSTGELARYATFYFDVRKELVAFTLGRFFGRNQFCLYLEFLLDEYVEEVSFNVSLIIDKDSLKEKIERFKRISRIYVSLVAPNPNEEEFNKMFAANGKNLKDMNAQQYGQEFKAGKKGEGLKDHTDFVNTLIDGVSGGYGKMEVDGIDDSNEEIKISSAENYPYKRSVTNNEKNSLSMVRELGERYIKGLMSKFRRWRNGKNAGLFSI